VGERQHTVLTARQSAEGGKFFSRALGETRSGKRGQVLLHLGERGGGKKRRGKEPPYLKGEIRLEEKESATEFR